MYDPFQPNDFRSLLLERKRLRESVAMSHQLDVQAHHATLTPEEAYKERVRMSAVMGIQSAQELQREEDDLRHKEHVQQGKDVKSKVERLLGKIGEGSIGPVLGGLEFVPSGMTAGGHVLMATEKKATKPAKGLKGIILISSWFFGQVVINAWSPRPEKLDKSRCREQRCRRSQNAHP